MSGVLDDVRVLDLTSGLAGPVATMFLAEAGAEVIKVETPDGDGLRGTAAFATWNRGKRSIVLELDETDDWLVFENLLSQADVLVHSLKGPEADRYGLDPTSVGQRHPGVVVCTIGDYPPGHPDAGRPGSDILVQARSGLMAEVVSRRPGPTFLRVPLPSWGAAYLACSGIVARLFVRERHGLVGPVRTSLLQGALFFLNSVWKSASRPSVGLREKHGLSKRPHPWMFTCADGRWIQPYVTFVASLPFVEALLSLGHVPPDIDLEPTNEDLELFQVVFASRTSDEWLQDLRAHDVDCEIMLHVGDIFKMGVAQEAGATIELGDSDFGRVRQAAVPFGTDPAPRATAPAPEFNQHGAAIRRSGWGKERQSRQRHVGRHGDGDMPRCPLAGIRVLDLGVWISGPLCSTLLGDLGAEVVKVESLSGDPSRSGDLFFLAGNRSKRSLAIDLRKPGTRPILTELVRRSDILVHNMRLSKARALAIDYESVHAINADIVDCEISAYSERGPYADVPGRDTLVGALSGWTLDGGDESTGPIWLRMMVGDTTTAAAGLIATLLGMYHRERTGRGSRVSASLLRTACMYSSETLVRLDTDSVPPVALSLPGAVGLSPSCRIYNGADGWLAISTDRARLDQLCERLGVGPDDLEKTLHELPLRGTLACLEELGIPAEEIDPDPEARFFSGEGNRKSGLINVYEHPVYGTVAHPFGYWDFDSMSCVRGVPAPTLGQDTVPILCELGVSETEITELTEQGAIRQDGPS